MPVLSLRYQLGIALIAINVIGTAIVAVVGYRASRDALESQALRSVELIAAQRVSAATRLLEQRQDRFVAFLGSVEGLCGEVGPRGTIGWEPGCTRVALTGFHRSENAVATELRYRGRVIGARGKWRRTTDFPHTGLAMLVQQGSRREYVMQAIRGRLSIRARFRLDDLSAVFEDLSGLQAHGELFVTDRRGVFQMGGRYAFPGLFPASMEPVERCLAGSTGSMVSVDYRQTAVISGFQPIPAIAGGCVLADIMYEDALAPVYRLEQFFLTSAAALVLVVGLLSVIIAGVATKPIRRLVRAAQALAAGDFDLEVPIAGAADVRNLGRALARMARSLTEMIQREHRLRMEAEAANRTKDEFLAMVSHELRTPLNAIVGWASILRRSEHGDQDDGRTSHALGVIERSARAQAQLIDDLLDVSRIASGTLRLNIANIPVGAAAAAAIEAVRPAADAKNIELRTHSEVPGRIVSADVDRLEQVIWNLLANAVSFTPSGGLVELTIRDADGDTEIEVSDTGAGIPAALLPHVFERFRQGDSSTTRRHRGLGLGLAIVQSIVTLHGGTVRAASEGEGQGARFTVRLPRAAAVAESAAVPRPHEQFILRNRRILVADDDVETCGMLRTLLEDAGATVTTTGSAHEARNVLRTMRPDLLIADIEMPDEDGYSLIHSIRTAGFEAHDVPAIALTAHGAPEDVERALNAGFQLHMAKPVDIARLVDSIASLIAGV